MKISSRVLKQWMNLLGNKYVITDEEKLNAYRSSSLGIKSQANCVLIPGNIQELSACLKFANTHGISVYPISRGKNYGYTSVSADQGPYVIIDLKRLNKIIECNNEYGYVIVEPGATFKQVYEHIAKHAPNYKLSSFGGSSQASMMGNALERGVGKGPSGNREAYSEILEIALANGDIAPLKNYLKYSDKTALFQYSSIGVNLSPLFFQSNLAIVSKMLIWLEPIPDYMGLITFAVEKEKQLTSLLRITRELIQTNLISPVYSFYNDVRLIIGSGSRVDDYPTLPFKEIKSHVLSDLKKQYGREISAWNSSFCISASSLEEIKLKTKLIKSKLSKLTQHVTINVIDKKTAKKYIQISIKKNVKIKESDFKFLFNLGYTNDYDQQSLYWRMPRSIEISQNPIKDGCGLIWFAPKIPFDSKKITAFYTELKNIAGKFNRELPVTFQIKSACLVYAIIPITFNQLDALSVKQAHQFYQALLQAGYNQGYLPYRLPTISMPTLFDSDQPYLKLLRKIKEALDPNAIISPGHYSKK